MPMPPYPIYCYTKGCKHLATYKIAARWSDGRQSELKTYGLCCEGCLPAWFKKCRLKHLACKLIPGETLESVGIFPLKAGQTAQQLPRLTHLEVQFGD